MCLTVLGYLLCCNGLEPNLQYLWGVTVQGYFNGTVINRCSSDIQMFTIIEYSAGTDIFYSRQIGSVS